MGMPFFLPLLVAAGIHADWAHVGPFASEEPIIAAPAAEEEEDGDDPAEAESESFQPGMIGPEVRYTTDLSDAQLEQLWQGDLSALGSISVGFADQGRMINAMHMPEDPAWICQRPELAWGAQETVESLATAFRTVHVQFPQSSPARLSNIGAREGGYLRPHRSHQSGRDADIGFFYKNDAWPRAGARRERLMDPARNWALIRALVTQTDVQVILVDRSVQKVLREYALSIGEDRDWLGRIFGGKGGIVQHARHHRDHFHVRFFAPRSQELGRRIQPLLSQRPEQNLVVHKVKPGQTLGQLARAYKTSVAAIRKANRMRGSFLHLSQRLLIPLRGPCTHCPMPPPVTVRARCLPPAPVGTATTAAMTATTTASAAP